MVMDNDRILLMNNDNKDNFCALQLSLIKDEYQIPGPGSYEVEGQTKYSVDIIAEKVTFLSSKKTLEADE